VALFPACELYRHLTYGEPALTSLADGFVNVDQNVTDLRGNIRLDGAGHWLPLERTKEVNAALLDFLGGLRTQGAFHRRAVPGCWS
jgi:pimeloyl-ACP methyl ester carboxylesterase